MNFFRWYNKVIEQRPITTKCFTSFITFGCGDLICQQIEKFTNKEKKFDFMRTIKQGSFGFVVTPYLHLQFCIIMPYLFRGKGLVYTIKNITYDQSIGAPIFTSLFFMYLDMSSGKRFEEAKKELQVKLLPTLIMNWKIWPFLMAINFAFLPIQYRVLYANIMGMFWSAYLSYMQNLNKVK